MGVTKRYYTAKEVAEMMSVTPEAIYYMIGKGEIPFVRLGRSVRIPIREFEAMLEATQKEVTHA